MEMFVYVCVCVLIININHNNICLKQVLNFPYRLFVGMNVCKSVTPMGNKEHMSELIQKRMNQLFVLIQQWKIVCNKMV